MAEYTVGDFLGQDSTEYLVTQILLKIKAVRDMLSGVTQIDVQVADEVPTNPPANPDTTYTLCLFLVIQNLVTCSPNTSG